MPGRVVPSTSGGTAYVDFGRYDLFEGSMCGGTRTLEDLRVMIARSGPTL